MVKAGLQAEYDEGQLDLRRRSVAETAVAGGNVSSWAAAAAMTDSSLAQRRRLSSMTLTKPVNDGVFNCNSPETKTLFDSGDKGFITMEKGRYATGLQVAVSCFGVIKCS